MVNQRISRKKTIRKIFKWLQYIFCIFILLTIVFFLFYIISSKICEKKGKPPIIGIYTIVSPSMSKTINEYDVVMSFKTDTDKLKKGDIITFYSTDSYFGNTPITHRIVDIRTENNEKSFITKGDNNKENDEFPIKKENIIGKVAFIFHDLGKVQYYLASKKGWAVVIILPAILIIIYNILRVTKLIKTKRKEDKIKNKNGNI